MDRGREVLLRARDVRGMTPMMHAALRGQIKVMHYLHSTHEHPYHDIDRDGRGLLHCAAEMGHVLTVRYLLRNERVDPSFKTNDGRTALHIAAYHCYPDVCRVLLRNNIAELGVCDKSGKDAHGFVAKQESITKRYNQIITMNVLNYAECCTDEGDISTPTLLSFREKVILNNGGSKPGTAKGCVGAISIGRVGAHNHLAFCTFLAVGGLLGVLYTAAFIACLLHQYEEFEVLTCNG
eukprot:CFRG2035T1